jgi:hypothetical protein
MRRRRPAMAERVGGCGLIGSARRRGERIGRGGLARRAGRVAAPGADRSGGCGGRLRASSGDIAAPVYARSAVKPFQALPLVEDGVMDRLGLTDAEMALACAVAQRRAATRGGAVAAAQGRRRRGGAGMRAALAVPPRRRRGSCAGRGGAGSGAQQLLGQARGHDGAGAGARLAGADGYHEPEHPVQRGCCGDVALVRAPGKGLRDGTDGCGVVTFAAPLDRLAAGFARFSRAARQGESGARRVVSDDEQPGPGRRNRPPVHGHHAGDGRPPVREGRSGGRLLRGCAGCRARDRAEGGRRCRPRRGVRRSSRCSGCWR